MLLAIIFQAEPQASAAAIVFSAAITFLSWWGMRKCWRMKPRSAAPPKPTVSTASVTEFYSKVVGTSHRNTDGTSRQSAIRKHCFDGAPLDLVREPNNKHDPNAIAVFYNDHQLGYLSAEIAGDYAKKLDQGTIHMEAFIEEITGGHDEKKTLGLNIVLSIHEHY